MELDGGFVYERCNLCGKNAEVEALIEEVAYILCIPCLYKLEDDHYMTWRLSGNRKDPKDSYVCKGCGQVCFHVRPFGTTKDLCLNCYFKEAA